MYQSYVIFLAGYDTLEDLIILRMVDFDIILDMDWRFLHLAILDCYVNAMTLAISSVLSVEWTGASDSYPSKFISFI